MKRNSERFTPPPLVDSTCTECGGLVPAAYESRDALFLAVLVQTWQATVP